MPYRFKLNEPVKRGFQRIGCEQIDRAERELARAEGRETAIHETRKSLKRLRALLRLARPGLPEKDYKKANESFRQIGALLSEARDNQILLQTIAKLEVLNVEAPLQGVKRIVERRQHEQSGDMDPGLTAAALSALRAARAEFEALELVPSRFETLRDGFVRCYGHGRTALKSAYKQPEDEVFHELRKRVQQHWRHLQLLENAWPQSCAARIASARELSQILGDDHDLAVLKTFLRALPRSEIGPLEARTIRRAIRERQDALRSAAEPRAKRLFAEKPVELGRTLAVLWSSARQLRDEDRRELAQKVEAEEPGGEEAVKKSAA